MDLDHIGDHFTAGQAVVDTVGTLAFAVADIGSKITGSVAVCILNALAGLFYQLIQMTAARMGITKSRLNNDLGQAQLFRFPARTQTKRIHFRR